MGKEDLRGSNAKQQHPQGEGQQLTYRFIQGISTYLQDAQSAEVLRPHQHDVFEGLQKFDRIRIIFFLHKLEIGFVKKNQDISTDFAQEIQRFFLRDIGAGRIIGISDENNLGFFRHRFLHARKIITKIF